MGAKHHVPARQAGLILLLLLAAACASDEAAAPPTTTAPPPCSEVRRGEERVDIGDRWYLRRVPRAHDGGTRVPVVVDLHGYSEGAELHADRTRLGAFGDREGFVTVTPHALGELPAWDLARDGIDVAFLADVLDDVEEDLCVDADRIYVTGHSMGGFLISSLACTELTARVAAFAPVAGVRAIEDCEPPVHRPALVIHATGDQTVLYDGGVNAAVSELLELPLDGPSVPDIVDEWAARDPNVDVDLLTIAGGDHDWPDAANARIWRFFERHRR